MELLGFFDLTKNKRPILEGKMGLIAVPKSEKRVS